MNAVTNTTPRNEARDEAVKVVVKGVVEGAVGLFCCLIDGMIAMAEEKRMVEKTARRIALREFLQEGNKMRRHQMGEALRMYDASLEEIAAELQMPVKELKQFVRPWWSLF